ncbi:MAG TPA: hypothetical protein VMM60_04115 [Ilumatobacter sp.]|nr:hypothetical protein [Ilumatobacter sp.]
MSGIDDQSKPVRTESPEYFDESAEDFVEAFGDVDDTVDELDDAGAESPGVLDRAMPDRDPADEAFVRAAEARNAIARASAIAAGRRKGGVAGAALAGAMFAVAEIYEGPRKEKTSGVVEASSDPNDLDVDGLEVTVGEVSVASPALERLEPVSERDSRRRPVV